MQSRGLCRGSTREQNRHQTTTRHHSNYPLSVSILVFYPPVVSITDGLSYFFLHYITPLFSIAAQSIRFNDLLILNHCTTKFQTQRNMFHSNPNATPVYTFFSPPLLNNNGPRTNHTTIYQPLLPSFWFWSTSKHERPLPSRIVVVLRR